MRCMAAEFGIVKGQAFGGPARRERPCIAPQSVAHGHAHGWSCVDGCAVYLSTNNDSVPDFAIHMVGQHTLSASDFIFNV